VSVSRGTSQQRGSRSNTALLKHDVLRIALALALTITMRNADSPLSLLLYATCSAGGLIVISIAVAAAHWFILVGDAFAKRCSTSVASRHHKSNRL
jgi:hypothetical protein